MSRKRRRKRRPFRDPKLQALTDFLEKDKAAVKSAADRFDISRPKQPRIVGNTKAPLRTPEMAHIRAAMKPTPPAPKVDLPRESPCDPDSARADEWREQD